MSTIPINAWPRINVTMPQITRATAMSQSIGAISTSHRCEMDVRRIGKRVPPYETVHSLSSIWSFALTFIARSLSGISSANDTGPWTSGCECVRAEETLGKIAEAPTLSADQAGTATGSVMLTTLPSDRAAPAQARHLAGSYMDGLGVDAQIRRSVQLMVSELVTNAVQHGGPPIRLFIRAYAGHLIVEVEDCGPPLPHDLAPQDLARGRGLFIVERLSIQWGERSHDQGKTIWCDVSLTPPKQR